MQLSKLSKNDETIITKFNCNDELKNRFYSF